MESPLPKLSCCKCDKVADLYMLHPCEHVYCSVCLRPEENCAKCGSTVVVKENIDRWLAALASDKTTITIRKPSKVLKMNRKGQTALHLACIKGDAKTVEELLGQGVDFNCRDYVGWTPLHDAVSKNFAGVVELLLKAGALPNVPAYETYYTPLHLCQNDREIVELLCKYGADPNVLDASLTPALYRCDDASFRLPSSPQRSHVIFTNTASIVCYKGITKEHERVIAKNPTVFRPGGNGFARLHENVTHLIVGSADALPTSTEVLQAIGRGIFLVTENWIDDHLKYDGSVNVLDYVPEIEGLDLDSAYRNALMLRPRLFDRMHFYVPVSPAIHRVNEHRFTCEQLKEIVTYAGGRLSKREPAERVADDQFSPYHADKQSDVVRCSFFIVYDANSPPQLKYKMKELKHVSSEWLVKCLTTFRVSNVETHL